MLYKYFLRGHYTAGLLMGLWLLAAPAWAQAPAWTLATAVATPLAGGTSFTTDVVADASGNLLVTGSFTGQVAFGTTTLTSAGGSDFFIAKYLTATNTWAWAQRGGGTADDNSYGLAVSGSSVYLTGAIGNDLANTANVTLSSTSPSTGSTLVPVRGSTSTASPDLLVAKYTDTGTGATLGWTQVGGGTGTDQGYGIAVSGTSVYVVGFITNNLANAAGVVFGGTGTVAGTATQLGVSTYSFYDIVVAKYVDQGTSATLGWTQVGGGHDIDIGYSIAVRGANVYITGASSNDKTNSLGVLYGGSGTTLGTVPQYGTYASPSADIVVVKYVDNGPTATVAWTQIGGGGASEQAYGIAVSGSSVYVTGLLVNNQANGARVLFGGSGTTAGTQAVYGASPTNSSDIVLAKYTDNGATATFNWAQVGGGTDYDYGTRVLVNGPNVYLAGVLNNNTANGNGAVFGGAGTVVGTATQAGASATASSDVLVAKYTDNGATATLNWTQVAGGTQQDVSRALALANASLYVVGAIAPTATFGSLSITAPTSSATGFLGGFPATVLAATPPLTATGCTLFPNPAPGAATLSGAAPGATVHVFDALGRRVATATADASGAATLPAGLVPGLYLVRAGTATVRWVVE